MRETVKIPRVEGCARCKSEHIDILAEELEIPIAPKDYPDICWDFWFMCPTTLQPVMVKMTWDFVEDTP